MSKHPGNRFSLVAVLGLLGVVSACGSESGGGQALPEFSSLEDTYQAVDAVLGCGDDVGDPPTKHPLSGGPTGESVLCTETVEVLWFDSQEAYDNVYELYGAAAGNPGSVYLVEGHNWFVADVAEVAIGVEDPKRNTNLEALAENLGAQYAVKR
ncbi:MAG: hypothetical protein ACQEXN_00110 [Actinomycetota bacterium]